MKKTYPLFISAIATFLFLGCGKDDNANKTTNPISRMELITGHGWKLNKFYEDGIDVTNTYFSACEIDNIFTYKTDYTYVIDEGPSKCLPTDPQIIETGTWAFANNQNILVYEPGLAGETSVNITQLDANNFKYEETNFDSTTMTTTTFNVHFVKS